jgi:hypothetical protein
LRGALLVWGVVSESATSTVKLARPAVVGVPVITPAELNDNPAGRLLPLATDQVYVPEPPVADSVAV